MSEKKIAFFCKESLPPCSIEYPNHTRLGSTIHYHVIYCPMYRVWECPVSFISYSNGQREKKASGRYIAYLEASDAHNGKVKRLKTTVVVAR